MKSNVENEYLLAVKNPEIILSRLNTDPWLITRDRVIHIAITWLQIQCLLGNERDSISAKKVLEKFGLSVFIPKPAKVRMSKYPILRYFKLFPNQFTELINHYKRILKPFFKNRYIGEQKTARFYDAKKALEHLLRRPLNNKEINLITGDRNSTLPNVALTYVSLQNKIPYEALRKIYNKRKHMKNKLPFKFES